jgi:hypothetical protein
MPTEPKKPLIVISYAHADEPKRPAEGEVKAQISSPEMANIPDIHDQGSLGSRVKPYRAPWRLPHGLHFAWLPWRGREICGGSPL